MIFPNVAYVMHYKYFLRKGSRHEESYRKRINVLMDDIFRLRCEQLDARQRAKDLERYWKLAQYYSKVHKPDKLELEARLADMENEYSNKSIKND